jgi:transcriptional regulator
MQMNEWNNFNPEQMRHILYDTSMLSLYVDAVQSATKPTVPPNLITNPKWLKGRDLYAQGLSMQAISRRLKVSKSVVETWQQSDQVDWNQLRLKYMQLSAAQAMYSHVQSQLESGDRIKALVDDIIEESTMLPFKSKGEAIRVALELDDRRRLISGEKTSKDAVITITTLIKAQHAAAKDIVDVEHTVIEPPPEDLDE